MTPLEQKEIKGINVKNLLAIIVSTITIVSSVLVGVGKINKRIDDQNYLIEKVVYMNETEVRLIKARLDVIEAQILEFKNK